MQVTTRLLIFLAVLGLARPGWADQAPDPGHLRLADVERLVVERNRALVSARRATQAAEAGIDAAAARPNPVVSLNTSGIGVKRPAGSGNLDTVLRIDQPIERGGKRQLRLAVADSLLAASQADENDALRQQRFLARGAYFDLKAAEDKARLAGESARLAHEVLAKAELRLRAGDLSPVDVARIRTDALKADGDARQAQVDRQRARLALAQLLALEAEAPQLATADPWPRLDPLPAGEPDLSRRPDVAAASRRLEAARTGIDLAKSLRVRDVTVGAQVERDNSTETRAGNLVGFGVSIPLFTGYDYRGEIRRAHVDRDAAADDLERLKATAAAEVVQAAFEANELSERARRLQEEALPAARKTSAAVQFAFTQGAASVLDVIDARRSLHVVETDTANALADAAKARAAWAAALNRPELP